MQSRLSVDALLELMYQGSLETLYMVGVAAVFTLLLGLPTGVLLVVTRHSAPDLGINLPIALTQYLQNDLLVSC